MADGKPGAPRKPDDQKKINFYYTMNRKIGEQLHDDADYMGEKASKFVSDFARRLHEFTEDIEVQKLSLQKKIVEHKKLGMEIEEDERRIKETEVLIKYSKKRADNPEYMADYQRIVDRLIAYPKEQAHIQERAKTLAKNHGYYYPLVKKDLEDAIAKSSGQYNYNKNGRKGKGLAGAYS